MKEKEMEQIGELIYRALQEVGHVENLRRIGEEVRALCEKHPIYLKRVADAA